ncbi:MAG TPA: SpoIIE family protein phosphatase [Blastocatellia bacterium]|jgi:serine phosphatase RsbU (regulator of sigma subunit)/MFS family permease|nr:SpoIIE family protein phosphatase [Blastocatellia bacterium]
MSKQLRILLGCFVLALMSANFGLHVYSTSLPKKGSYRGFSAFWDGKGDPRITDVNPGALAADFQVGDELIAVDGVNFRDDPGVLISRNDPPGTRVRFTIRRAGALRDVTVHTVPHWERKRLNPLYYINLLFLLTGWAVFLLRPDDKQAWLLALMLATLTGLVGDSPDNLPLWLVPVVWVGAIAGLLFSPVFVHFFLIFPGRSPLLRRWPRVELWLYSPFLFITLPVLGPNRYEAGALTAWMLQSEWYWRFNEAAVLVIIAYLAAGLVCLIINYQAESLINRRRLRVVMAGSSAGFFNLFLLIAGVQIGLGWRMPTLWSWLDTTLYITLPFVPVSFVYAIVRHKVIPISLIIRRGLRYLLVSRGSIALLTGVVGMALYFAMDAFFYRYPMSGRNVGIISAISAIFVWQLARTFHLRVVAPKIDRLFFHEAYDARQIIAELAESLRATTRLPKLLELVATSIQSAMRSSSVAIFLRDEASGDYPCVYYCVYSFHNRTAPQYPFDGALARDSDVIRRMSESGQLIDLESRDELQSENNEDRELLRKLNSALLLPIMANDELLGIISVGAHLGDLPFSSDDKKLLLSVSAPASFALENIRLIERTVEDARRRQELEAENEQRARELEGARQLQLSMLPKNVPQLPHLDIEAYMKPATEVGGDYYDFHLDGAGTLTVAVGDATGHGLKAGTVVTAMKSLFRTFAAEPEIVPVFNRSSRVLKEMNLRSLFMGLTMIKLNGRRMKIASAGMPPVLIYRAETRSVEEVMIKAMPLGSIPDYPYRELELTLGCGDVVVMMSDGLPERFNREGEMFDYSRTMETLTDAAARSPREIIECLAGAGEDWADGRPQDDDVTFVVLKVK